MDHQGRPPGRRLPAASRAVQARAPAKDARPPAAGRQHGSPGHLWHPGGRAAVSAGRQGGAGAGGRGRAGAPGWPRGARPRTGCLRQVVHTMVVEMHAGLASDGGSKLKMLLTFVDALPTGYIWHLSASLPHLPDCLPASLRQAVAFRHVRPRDSLI
ncbi:unnamed protein product [Miscanthus lutarioriparius]|uniref:Hexokinase N-terminal domain-containing protein n=1 Tax=Miscanthus lutarioriparius TaxID=422564 RepID=A0A811RFR9_9POAL|nr:unnamed protein product [Miscanthus lutarioriparius]